MKTKILKLMALSIVPALSQCAAYAADANADYGPGDFKAKAEGKLVYACFSGSDWCYWCKKLESEVLSKEEFISGVKDDFVLVFIDTPGNKDVLSAHAKAANKELVKKYKVSGFPTALILDGDGKKVGETGYRKGGAAEYVKHLNAARQRKGRGHGSSMTP